MTTKWQEWRQARSLWKTTVNNSFDTLHSSGLFCSANEGPQGGEKGLSLLQQVLTIRNTLLSRSLQ
jgi:hypothetical protein